MAVFRAIFFVTTLVYLADIICGQSDLRSALAAIDRRQKELADYEEQQQYGYSSYDQPNDLAFLSNVADNRGYDKDYLDDDNYDSLTKRFSSSFRERLEEDKQKQMEEFARNLINNLESNGMPGAVDENYLRELWDRYYGNDVSSYGSALNKRYYYPVYGTETVAQRKRGRYLDNEDEPIYSIHHHVPRDDDSDYQMNYLRNRYYHGNSYSPARQPYTSSKRFAVAKRSSTYNNEQKRSVKKTDPKVEKDLSNIFGGDQKANEKVPEAVVETTTPKFDKPKKKDEVENKKIEKKDNPKKEINKEVFAPVAPQNKKTLQLKKREWSDYFGLDRRKKSDSDSLDKEWLMERYHKAIAITAKKRNAELPLQSFRNHDIPTLKKENPHDKQEQKINEMDSKLEKLEDEIVGDALKYTGAHQDDVDSKEVQQIKDNIIARLAQAYNIEKMRNALEEYKTEIEKARKEVEKSKTEDKIFDDYTLEEKRLSVPRKEAVDDSRDSDEADNNIKCTTSEDCHEQNYKTPAEVFERHFASLDQCPAIQRACNDVASIIGHYGHVFEAACNIHQMCLLCSNNSWFSPTRQCNMLFLTKAYELCLGKEECKKEARRSVRYLLDINKSLQAQSALNDECELQCPDTDMVSK